MGVEFNVLQFNVMPHLLKILSCNPLYLCILCVLCLYFSCDSNSVKDTINYSITIDSDKRSHTVEPAIAIWDSILIIPLETSEASLIQRISKVKIGFDQIFLFDDKLQEILIFQRSGKYIRKIATTGKGAGEVLQISDFDIDFNRKVILILSRDTKTIHIFNTDGVYQSRLLLDFYPERFAVNDKGFIALTSGYYDDKNYNLHIIDYQGNQIYDGYKFPLETKSFSLASVTGGIKSNGGPYFLYSDALSNKIQEVSAKGEVIKTFEFTFDKNWPESDQYKFDYFFNELNNGNVNFLSSDYILIDSVLMFTYNLKFNNNIRTLFKRKGYYNLSTRELITQENFLRNSLMYNMTGPVGIFENKFISVLYPDRMENIDQDMVKGLGIEKIEDFDNPFLFLHSIAW